MNRSLEGDRHNEWARIGGYSNHGVWGLDEYYDSQPANYPKLATTLQTARKWV